MIQKLVRSVPVVLLSLASAAATIGTFRWRDAIDDRDQAIASFESASTKIVELERLRAELDRDQVSTSGRRADALGEIADTFAASGLSAQSLASLVEQSDAPVADSELHRQTLRLTLSEITPATLGKFLVQLFQDRPHWIVTSLELTRSRQSSGNEYDVHVLMVRTYQQGEGGEQR